METKLQKSYFDVLGLCCSSEVPLIHNILNSLNGVKDVTVIVPSRTVIVLHDTLLISQLQIVKALNDARLEANVRAYGATNQKKKWPSPYTVACGVLLSLSFLKYIYHPLSWLAIGAVIVGIYPILLKVISSIRNFRPYDISILMSIAVVGTIAMRDYTESATIVFLFTIAEWLQTRACHKANVERSALMNIVPQKAIIAETGEEVDVNDVEIDTIIAIKAGESIPIDGIVVDGDCEVDERTLTGESYPVAKNKDSLVYAGTINLNGYIRVKTTAIAEDSVVSKMAKLVEEAQKYKSNTEILIDKVCKFYTPAVILFSACLAVVPVALHVQNRSFWFHLALVVLVSACPCALILSTPVVTYCALTKAAASGLLIKGGNVLEILAKIKVAAFDKTGTITRGEFVVSHFQSLGEKIDFNTLLFWVSSIESKSSHPMAAALVAYAKMRCIDPNPESVEDYKNFPGEGIYGKIAGENIYIGNRKIAHRAGCEAVPLLNAGKKMGTTVGYIYSGSIPVGVFSLSDACRSRAAEAIKKLKSLRIKTAMLTGDNQAAAMHAQEELGNVLDIVQSELLPEDKAKIINEFKKEGSTVMIGDGINDAPALATADIGISMGISGSALATETGQINLMSNDITKIPEAVKLARKAKWKVIENIIFSITTKAAIVALAISGYPLVWAAVLADVGTCLLVILNSMLLLRSRRRPASGKPSGKCCKSSENLLHTHKLSRCKSSTKVSSHKHRGKCCQSPAESVHKHGNELDTGNSTHSHQHCCSESKTEKTNEHKHCDTLPSSAASGCHSTLCSDNHCSSLADKKRVCDAADDHHNHPGHHDHHDHHNHDIEAQSGCLGSCNENTCSESVEPCGKLAMQEIQEVREHGHCHQVVRCPGSEHHHHGLNHHHHGLNHHEGKAKEHKCCTQHTDFFHGAIGAESVARAACLSLEKREIGGCCKSYYRKQCCGHHGQFAGAGIHGMTGIVTE